MDKERILVIDDDKSTRTSLSFIFRAQGYEVETADTGRAAIRKARECYCNLALIDIRLPDIQGVELLELLSDTNPDMVLILATGHASLESVVRAMNQGASACITKPIDMDELLEVVARTLERQRLIVENRRLYKAAQRELTERKRAEEELAQERYLLRALLENIPDHIYFKDTESRFLRCNPAMAQWFGIKDPSGLLGKSDRDFFTDEHAKSALADERRVMQTEEPLVNYEEKETWPDGRESWVSTTKMPLYDQGGQVIGTFGVSRDISAFKQAERELRQRAAQLVLLNEIGGQIAAELEVESVLKRAVELVQRSFGYHHVAIFVVEQERGDLLMRARAGSYVDLYPHEHRLKLGEGIVGWVGVHGERMLANDVRAAPQYLNLYPDFVRTASELSVPIRVGEEIVGVLDIQSPQIDDFDENDVIVMETLAGQIAIAIKNSRLYAQTQRRANELAFLNSASQMMVSSLDLDEVLQTTVRQATEVLEMEAGSLLLLEPDAGDLVFEAAWGGGSEGLSGQRIPVGVGIAGWVAEHRQSAIVRDVYQDERFYSRFDEVAEEFVTRSILCVPLIYRDRIAGVMQALNKLEGEFTAEDQRLLEALASAAAIAVENARLYNEAQRELGERMRAERELRKERTSLAQRVAERTAELSSANAELARSARLKDEFLASMSHELRTPLNAILGLSEALQELVYGSLNERQLQSLRRIEESGRHLLELINEILDISKIEAGKLELLFASVNVESVCQASTMLIAEMAQQKRLTLSTMFDSRLTEIMADERRLKQILVNLLSNACKFTPEGGKVGLDVSADVDNQAVHFSVWDTGIGIAEEDMRRLFEPFVQLDSSLSRRYGGTGLGLALVRRLTELHGGGISVESAGIEGQGSRFTVSLPWRMARHDGSGDADPPQTRPSEIKEDRAESLLAVPLILLAEDHEDNITTVVDYLRNRGYRLSVARNGLEAIARAAEERPDLILMDIQMPQMDGLEAIRRIRSDSASGVADVPIVALTALAMPGDRERCLAVGADVYLSKPVGLSKLVQVIDSQLGPVKEVES